MPDTQGTTERLRDAAFARLIPAGWEGGVGGYLHSPNAYNPWVPEDWALFPHNRKLPIWVAGNQPSQEAVDCVAELKRLGVPAGVPIVADMETRVDRYWLTHFGMYVTENGYKVWTYGSASTVFGNIAWNGYWVASYMGLGPFMYTHEGVRATQYQSLSGYDSSTVKDWVYNDEPWWV